MTGPAPAIRLLHLEDSEPDHALAMAYLQRGGLPAEPPRLGLQDPDEALQILEFGIVLALQGA